MLNAINNERQGTKGNIFDVCVLWKVLFKHKHC